MKLILFTLVKVIQSRMMCEFVDLTHVVIFYTLKELLHDITHNHCLFLINMKAIEHLYEQL